MTVINKPSVNMRRYIVRRKGHIVYAIELHFFNYVGGIVGVHCILLISIAPVIYLMLKRHFTNTRILKRESSQVYLLDIIRHFIGGSGPLPGALY